MKAILYIAWVVAFLFLNAPINAETVIYLTRHAEKVKSDDKNPVLSEWGTKRAVNIAKQLSAAKITKIYSTNYQRTLLTAKPLAELLDIEINIYDPRKLKEFSEKLKEEGGISYVVGHSNTTPQLTALLSGEKVSAIQEDEYDNLFQVRIGRNHGHLVVFKSLPSSISYPKKQ